MAYTTVENVRLFTGLSVADISDANLTSLIAFATAQLNAEINSKIINERIRFIDQTKKNIIDGDNTTYYLQIADIFPFGDADDDGDVDTTDLNVFSVDGAGTKTSVTVSSVTPTEGKFVVSTAPIAGLRLFCTYFYAPLDENTPHPLIVKATSELVGSLAFTKINASKIRTIKLGDLTITKQGEAFTVFWTAYNQTLKDIKTRMSRKLKQVSGRDIPLKFGMFPSGDTWWPGLGLERAKTREFL